ncbi:MAG: aminopeptidase P N-terminal domain-containing protein [Bacteroidales bacterium]|nr:aminopeptidase P N-terminal domain-containing protein [Bacteroidales bacterium]
MFPKETYIRRRAALREKLKGEKGIVVFLGNVEAPAQYRDNCYKFRQDSCWLYYFGIDEPRWAAVLDLESGRETLYADDVSISDIIWMGPQPSVRSVAESVGVAQSEPYCKLDWAVSQALVQRRPVHTVPASRYYQTLKLQSLGIEKPSEALVRAIVSMRLVKEPEEIELLDAAARLGQKMHTVARRGIRLGRREQEIVGEMEGVTLSEGWGVSFATILTQHGEIFHNHGHGGLLEPGRLLVVDAGAESNEHYASDFTRTYPTSGRYTPRQRAVYQLVYDCHELAFSLTRPGTAYRDVHLAVAERMLLGLKDLGLVQGDPAELAAAGIAGLFMPHGLGHNMGLDVHDMEDLGEDLVGYDPDQTRSPQLGLGSLRMARRLVPGNVITDEPGIYFIPALIEQWKVEGKDKGCVNYGKLAEYYDFGGIRLEDDVLVTPDGARRLGGERLPASPDEVEAAMAADKENK